MELTGCIVTTDAMGCRKKIARETIEADADHVLALKAQPRNHLTGLSLNVEQFAGAVRDHWEVENSCHRVLDVVMREDQSRARTCFSAESLATLRSISINLLNREKTRKRGIKGEQLNASWDHNRLLRLLNF